MKNLLSNNGIAFEKRPFRTFSCECGVVYEDDDYFYPVGSEEYEGSQLPGMVIFSNCPSCDKLCMLKIPETDI